MKLTSLHVRHLRNHHDLTIDFRQPANPQGDSVRVRPFTWIYGAAGSGKSTILQAIALAASSHNRLAAPTGLNNRSWRLYTFSETLIQASMGDCHPPTLTKNVPSRMRNADLEKHLLQKFNVTADPWKYQEWQCKIIPTTTIVANWLPGDEPSPSKAPVESTLNPHSSLTKPKRSRKSKAAPIGILHRDEQALTTSSHHKAQQGCDGAEGAESSLPIEEPVLPTKGGVAPLVYSVSRIAYLEKAIHQWGIGDTPKTCDDFTGDITNAQAFVRYSPISDAHHIIAGFGSGRRITSCVSDVSPQELMRNHSAMMSVFEAGESQYLFSFHPHSYKRQDPKRSWQEVATRRYETLVESLMGMPTSMLPSLKAILNRSGMDLRYSPFHRQVALEVAPGAYEIITIERLPLMVRRQLSWACEVIRLGIAHHLEAGLPLPYTTAQLYGMVVIDDFDTGMTQAEAIHAIRSTMSTFPNIQFIVTGRHSIPLDEMPSGFQAIELQPSHLPVTLEWPPQQYQNS